MTAVIYAPWTEAQVSALNRFQKSGVMHSFTCRAHTSVDLTATGAGWVCGVEGCDTLQQWAHAFMADPDWLAEAVERRRVMFGLALAPVPVPEQEPSGPCDPATGVPPIRANPAWIDGNRPAKGAEKRTASTEGLWGPGTNTGHGHVWERPDRAKARCGGHPLCSRCRSDARFVAALLADSPACSACGHKQSMHRSGERDGPCWHPTGDWEESAIRICDCWAFSPAGASDVDAEIARLKAALRVCEVVLHNGGVVSAGIGNARVEAWLRAAQQASSAHATDWEPARVLDDANDVTDPAYLLRGAALDPDDIELKA